MPKIEWNIWNKIKCVVILAIIGILTAQIWITYREIQRQGIDLLFTYHGMPFQRKAQVFGMFVMAGFFWYLGGKFLRLCDFLYLYPLVAVGGVSLVVLKSVFNGTLEGGENIFLIILGAGYRAGSVIKLWIDVFVQSQAFLTKVITWVLIISLILILLFARNVILYIALMLISLSPILGMVVSSLIFSLTFRWLSAMKNPIWFLVLIVAIIYIVYGIWGCIVVNLKEFSLERPTESFGDKLVELLDVEPKQFIYLLVCVVLLVLAYFFGFFKNWNQIVGFVIANDYNDVTATDTIYENGSLAMMLLISTFISFVVGIILDKFFESKSIINKITKILCAFLIQVTLAEVAMGWINKYVTTPISFQDEFTRWLNDLVLSTREKMPEIVGLLLVLFEKIILLLHGGGVILGAIVMVVAAIAFGIQCAMSIFTCNIIYILLAAYNIDVKSWPPLIFSILIICTTEFINGYIVASKFE